MTDREKLIDALSRCHASMLARAMEKYDCGFDGWDDPHWQRNMAGRMVEKAHQVTINAGKLTPDDTKDLIDIANFAAFLWWQARATP